MGRRRIASRRDFPDNLYRKTDGYFWYRNPQNGETKGLGHDKQKAFKAARQANAALATVDDLNLADWVLGKDGKTLADWASEYQGIYIETRDAAKNTIASMKTCVRAIIAAEFSSKPLERVTTKEISAFLDQATLSRGARMTTMIRSCLQDMFREAATKGLVDGGFNPASITRKPKLEVLRDRLSLEQFLTIREKSKVWGVNAMNLALITGQRREDIALAKFSDIKDGFWYCEQGKTGMKIRIPLTLRLNAIGLSVGDVVKQCRDNIVSQYLIHHQKQTAFAKPGDAVWKDTISKEFAKARVKAGIAPQEGKEPPTFHEIRSLAERLYEKEYDRAFAQKLLGHKSEKMTATYADVRGSEWLDVVAG